MFKSKRVFSYLDNQISVTKDGEKYVSVSVIDKETTGKFSFISKNEEVINVFSHLDLQRFSDITLIVDFERVFNPNTRYSSWQPQLIGVE